jgi:outer membrane protein OmpA-like peptidoglycan-associated protein
MGSINTGVAAETLTTDDLIGMLQNKASAPTETLTQEELERRQQNRITVERAGSGKDITVEERKKLADIVKENSSPSIDMEIYFAYNSSAISPSSVPTLIKLGRAFSDFRLSKGTFMIAGHTDAKGSDNYNQQLSQRRARSVKRFLIENFDINSRKLIAIGYGEEQLKNRYDPFAEENRRVQVVNLGGVVTGH